MKRIVLIVVGAILAIAMIPIIVTSINRMTQEKVREEVVTFEILTETTLTSGTYDKLNILGETLNLEKIPVSIMYNSTVYNGFYKNEEQTDFIYIEFNNPDDYDYFFIYPDDTWLQEDPIGNILTVYDPLGITFEVTQPAQVTGVGAVLLGLVPILFVLGTVFSLVIFTKEWN